MAHTALPVTTTAGLTAVTWPATDGTAADVVNGNSFPNSPNAVLLITNTSATTAYTVTFDTPFTAGGLAIDNPIKTIPISGRQVFGPFDSKLFGNTVEMMANNVAIKFIVLQHT